MPQYYIWTVGCQMNQAESERLASYIEVLGYKPAKVIDEADLIVVNSCVVRQSAENRVINKLNSIKPLKKLRPGVRLAVTGCLVDSQVEQLAEAFPHVDYFFKAGDRPGWLENDGQWPVLPERPGPCAYVVIMQGCDNFCSYCIVPYRRGRQRSRPVREIVAEVRELIGRGVKEVTLLGQNVDSYGYDLPDKPDLAGLLSELNDIDGLLRIRFLTSHPKDMTSRLIDAVGSLDKVCEQINVPCQAGSNDILTAMRRGYSAERYRELIGEIRGKIDGVALSTDVIVGFPSETDSQFQETEDLLAELKFDTVHVAAYSVRPGTLAARKFDDNIALDEKKRRLARVETLQENVAAEINAQLFGKEVEVLIEGKKRDKWYGRTRTGKLVFFSGNGNRPGQLVNARVDRTTPWSLQGSIKSNDGE